MDGKSYLSLQEASMIMDKSIQTLRRLIKKGDLSAKRVRTPQGYQYVVSPELLVHMGYSLPQKPMFFDSPIQTEIIPQEEAVEDVSPYQAENLYSRTAFEPQQEKDFYVLDIQEEKILQNSKDYEEKMFLFSIIEKLQTEVNERRKSIFVRVFEWLRNRIMLAGK